MWTTAAAAGTPPFYDYLLSGVGALTGASLATFVAARVVHNHTQRSKGFDTVFTFNSRYQELIETRDRERPSYRADEVHAHAWWRQYFDLLQNEFYWYGNGLIPADVFSFWIRWQVRAYDDHPDSLLKVRGMAYRTAWKWWSSRSMIQRTEFASLMNGVFDTVKVSLDGEARYDDRMICEFVARYAPKRGGWNALKRAPLEPH